MHGGHPYRTPGSRPLPATERRWFFDYLPSLALVGAGAAGVIAGTLVANPGLELVFGAALLVMGIEDLCRLERPPPALSPVRDRFALSVPRSPAARSRFTRILRSGAKRAPSA